MDMQIEDVVGCEAEVIQRINGNQFQIGEIVRIIRANPVKDSYICLSDDDRMYACEKNELCIFD